MDSFNVLNDNRTQLFTRGTYVQYVCNFPICFIQEILCGYHLLSFLKYASISSFQIIIIKLVLVYTYVVGVNTFNHHTPMYQ